ncbi:MAG: TolC family protein, partial [Gammaproteobacteria bacterium]|nr:TolC family protein [Gammaproteobacteria bacterium]
MKKVKNIKALTVIIGAFVLPGAAQAASLLEIYQQALQSDPQIHEAEARRLAALEARPQARGAYLPQISAGSDYSVTNRSGPIGIFDPDTGERRTVDAEIETDVVSWNVTLRQ